jgi:hypothetical protein
MQGAGTRSRHSRDIRLVLIGDHFSRDHRAARDRLAKERPGTRRVAVLAKEHTHNHAVLINDAAFGQQLKDLPAGQRVGQVPAHRGEDHVLRPAIAAEGRGRVLGERAPTGAARAGNATLDV